MSSAHHGRILVVDDNENNRDLLLRRLGRRGHLVVAAADGRAGLRMLHERPFDLLLLDLMMPELDGFGLLGILKADPALRHLPVIVISALDELEGVVRCIELGADDYLTKPLNTILLHAKIDACLDRKRLRDQEQSYLAAVRHELDLARRTQADFLPATLPQPPGWAIAAAFLPAREVAGDFYDAFPLAGDRLGLLVGDVCDKGVGAALFMALTRSLLRAFAEQADAAGGDPLAAVGLANGYIARHHRVSRTYATVLFAELDLASGDLRYINAGHPPPVIIRPGGGRALLEPTGPAVGFMPDSAFATAQARLQPGDTLLAYTDGVTEARAPGGELFGEERLLAALAAATGDVGQLMAQVQAAAIAHAGQAHLADDITMLAAQRAG